MSYRKINKNISKWRINRQRTGRARKRGVTIVVVSLSMVSLLGLCALSVDYGMLTNDANQLQRTCDAAALAGVQELKKTSVIGTITQDVADAIDKTNAYNKALLVANQNGLPSSQISAINFLNNNTQIQVVASRSRNFFFGRAIGVPSGRVNRAALAGLTSVTGGVTGAVVPLGITEETYDAYRGDQVTSHELTLIRQNKTVFERDITDPVDPDPVVLFDVRQPSGKSGAHMQRQITGEERDTSNIGDLETTLNASLSSEGKKMEEGFGTLFQRAAGAPWNDPVQGVNSTDWQTVGRQADEIIAGTARRDNPRVVNLIVTPSTSQYNNGTFNTEVKDFAPVYVESIYEEEVTVGHGRNAETFTVLRMRVRFLPPLNVSSGDPNYVQGGTGGAATGARFVQLLG